MPDFTTLTEAKILIEEWHKEYNQVRPHDGLNYRPPTPEAIIPLTLIWQVVLLVAAGQTEISTVLGIIELILGVDKKFNPAIIYTNKTMSKNTVGGNSAVWQSSKTFKEKRRHRD